jgi:uncharacterized membrane-anchored protein
VIEIDSERQELVAEMHLRPVPALRVGARMIQVLSLLPAQGADHFAQFLLTNNIEVEGAGIRRDGKVIEGAATMMWERHSEAATVSVILPGDMEPAQAAALIERIETVPGRILRAIQVDIASSESEAGAMVAKLGMRRDATIAGKVGGITFWSDFKLRESDGYGRLVVLPEDEESIELGRVVRDLQELGNYRNLALLALPLVRRNASLLAELEAAALRATARLTDSNEDRASLDELIQLSARLSRLRGETAYRLGATAAYGQIVSDRMRDLDPMPVAEFQHLSEFTNRRFLPALRTCENFSHRLDALAARIEQATNLLRTRVDVGINEKNADVLRSLDSTARRQLQLQHLVEGLSVFAIAYYAIGLLSYLFGAVPDRLVPDKHLAIGLMVVPVFLALTAILRWQRRVKN